MEHKNTLLTNSTIYTASQSIIKSVEQSNSIKRSLIIFVFFLIEKLLVSNFILISHLKIHF